MRQHLASKTTNDERSTTHDEPEGGVHDVFCEPTDPPGAGPGLPAAFFCSGAAGSGPGSGNHVQSGGHYHQLLHLPRSGCGGRGGHGGYHGPGGGGAGGAPVCEIWKGYQGIPLPFPDPVVYPIYGGHTLCADGHKNVQMGGCHPGRGPGGHGGNGAERCVRSGGFCMDPAV